MMKFLMSVIAGKQPKIDKVGLSYMLLGEAREGQNIPPTKDPSQVKQWFYTGPHINPAQAVRLARGPIFRFDLHSRSKLGYFRSETHLRC